MGIEIDKTRVIVCCSVFGTGSDSKTIIINDVLIDIMILYYLN